jgi:hypothetical protein
VLMTQESLWENNLKFVKDMSFISLSKQQLVVTHTIRQTQTAALLDSLDTRTPSVKIL